MVPEDLPAIIGGKYRPRSVVGIGATGTVYSVEHAVTGEILALKVMKAHLGASASAIARFRREARAAATIRSQHVVRIFDADVAPELGGAPYLVMDLVEGKDLEQISNGLPVNPEDLIEWFRQVALALDKAHAKGIIHRDLKPENLFLTRLDDGTPLIKILDFGIAKITADPPGTTLSGQVFGTPLYMAPEQARGDLGCIGPSTDLFALGQIAYRLLTGVPYRTAASLTQMLHEIVNEIPQAPSARGHSLGAGFDQWFLRACHHDPAQRFASAHSQVEALARALGFAAEADAAEATPVSPRSAPSSSPDSRRSAPDSNPSKVVSAHPVDLETIEGSAALNDSSITTLPVPKEPTETDFSYRKQRRAALLASALVGGVLLVIAVAWGRSYREPLATPSACPVVPGAAPAGETPSVPDSIRTPAAAEAPPAVTIAARAVEALPARPAPVRSIPQHVVVAHRSPADDDPLSDQK
jgi:serine/threonine protein kinase